MSISPLEAPSKMRLRYLGFLKHLEPLNKIKKDTRDEFRGCKTPSKVKPMYFVVKLKECKFE